MGTWTSVAEYIFLAIVFGSAASAKVRTLGAFTDYLSVPFGRHARLVAQFVISAETALSGGLILGTISATVGRIVLGGVIAFLVVASLFIAGRLVLTDETDCACWGAKKPEPLIPPIEVVYKAVRPAWYGLRNGGLALCAWASANSMTFSGMTTAASRANIIALTVFALCPTIMAVGLMASTVMNWRYLAREEHPLKRVFAPNLAPLVALTWYKDGGRWGSGWLVSVPPAGESLPRQGGYSANSTFAPDIY